MLAPVLLKYDVKNEFLAKYEVEFAAGSFFAGVIYTSYTKVKADQAEKEAARAADKAAASEGNQ